MLVVVSPIEKAKIFNRNTHIGSPDSPTEGVQETLDLSPNLPLCGSVFPAYKGAMIPAASSSPRATEGVCKIRPCWTLSFWGKN